MNEPPPIPERMKRFPLWKDRYPIFFTVARTPDGKPEFRKVSRARQLEADRKSLCHLCGQKLQPPYWFICAPMEVEGKATKDGPMHEECACYAIAACPFLSNPHYVGHDPMASGNPAVLMYLIRHQEASGPPVRPYKLALCSAPKFRADFSEQYPFFYVTGWLSVDYTALPSRDPRPGEEQRV